VQAVSVPCSSRCPTPTALARFPWCHQTASARAPRCPRVAFLRRVILARRSQPAHKPAGSGKRRNSGPCGVALDHLRELCHCFGAYHSPQVCAAIVGDAILVGGRPLVFGENRFALVKDGGGVRLIAASSALASLGDARLSHLDLSLLQRFNRSFFFFSQSTFPQLFVCCRTAGVVLELISSSSVFVYSL
jgi:hypothetical protein